MTGRAVRSSLPMTGPVSSRPFTCFPTSARWSYFSCNSMADSSSAPRATMQSPAPFAEALRLPPLRRRDLRISRHEGEWVEQHDLETARVEARRYLRARRERDVALRRRAAGEHANADPVQSLASGQKTGSRL